MECPSLEQMVAFVRGQVDPADRERIAGHLATGCAACQKNQSWGNLVSGLLTGDQAADFPDDLIQWSVSQFKVHVRRPESRWQTWIARLVFDSHMVQPQAQVRTVSVEPGASRQLLFRTKDYDVDLRLDPGANPGAGRIVGQILPTGEQPYEASKVRLRRGTSEVDSVQPDDIGTFRFADVADGQYDIVVEMPQAAVIIPGIDIIRES